jgi:DNA-binding NarL/FixJ family response regulator
MTKIRVVAIDDHDIVLDAISQIVNAHPEMELVATGQTGAEIIPLLEQHHPDVLLLDQRLPEAVDSELNRWFRVLPAIQSIRRQHPAVRIIIFSASTEPVMVRRAIEAGVRRYMSKSDASVALITAIKQVMNGNLFLSELALSAHARYAETPLTKRQIEVLAAIKRNPTASNADLANELNLAESTFKKHLGSAMSKLDTPSNRLAAVQRGEQLGLF